MAAVLGIDHVQLAMPAGGEVLARAFYGETLGLHEVAKPEALRERGGCWFAIHGSSPGASGQLHLGVDADFRAARKAHPGLLVDDLVALTAVLVGHGIEVASDSSFPGMSRAFVHDPFGNRVELIQA